MVRLLYNNAKKMKRDTYAMRREMPDMPVKKVVVMEIKKIKMHLAIGRSNMVVFSYALSQVSCLLFLTSLR